MAYKEGPIFECRGLVVKAPPVEQVSIKLVPLHSQEPWIFVLQFAEPGLVIAGQGVCPILEKLYKARQPLLGRRLLGLVCALALDKVAGRTHALVTGDTGRLEGVSN